MTNRVKLVAVAWCLASAAFAQQPQPNATQKTAEEDNADFTFTESQLDEDNESAQTVSALVSAKTDPYLSEVGFLFSPMRFRVRALDNQWTQTYVNGINFNDAERGRFSYGMIGGLNDVTRNREGVSPFEPTTFGLPGIGGASSINMRASQQQQGQKLTLTGCNRNYVARAIYTYSSGLNAKGWAFSGSLGYRWAKEGVIEGTFYNSLSYYLAVEKVLNDKNRLSLVTFGAPTERGQQTASTEEAYWLANSHYYNPNWGYQNGEKRNSRVVNDYEPTTILTWDADLAQDLKLTTSAAVRYSKYSSTALGWNGNAYDPRPDYYKNLPSSLFRIYNVPWDSENDMNTSAYLSANPSFVDQWNTLYDYWTSDKANRQVNWDRMYYVNRREAANGGEALYYQERRHNDQLVFALNSVLSKAFRDAKVDLGLSLNATTGMHYKTMADLLGAVNYYDYDKFAANEYGRNSSQAMSDLRYPNRRIEVGDKFGYDYNIYVRKARLWGQFVKNYTHWDLAFGAHVDGTTFARKGLMQNGLAANNSYGMSGWAKFLTGGGKFRLAYNPSGNHRFSLAAGWDTEAPLPANSFVAPRMQNDFVDNLHNEDILSAELSYDFRFGPLTGKLSGYVTRFQNGVEQTAFYNDAESRFTYLTMSEVEKLHYGVEGALKLQVTPQLSFQFIGSVGEAKYTNNPMAQLSYQGSDAATMKALNTWSNPVTGEELPLHVLADGMRLSGTPLTALSLGANYNINGWFFELNLNYYDRVYVGFSQYRRLTGGKDEGDIVTRRLTEYQSRKVVDANGNSVWQYPVTAEQLKAEGGILFSRNPDNYGEIEGMFAPEQEKFKGGFMLDASIGRFIRLRHGRTLSVNLSLSNILNNRNLRTGGYEQNRDDNYNTGEPRPYQFSKNAKYYYANAFNAFLNIGLRF